MSTYDLGAAIRAIGYGVLSISAIPHWSSYAFGILLTFDLLVWFSLRQWHKKEQHRRQATVDAALGSSIQNFQIFLMYVHLGHWHQAISAHNRL